MTFKQTITSLFLLLTTIIAAAANPPPTSAPASAPPPTMKAFFRDDQLWTLTLNPKTHKYELPVCWENLATINDTVHHPAWKTRRITTLNYVNAAWGDVTNYATNPTGDGSASLRYFVDKGQCPLARVGFPGIRIMVSSTAVFPHQWVICGLPTLKH